MPNIIINETDNTVRGVREITSDNIVFIPGTAITGPSDPVILSSSADFKRTFGHEAPNSNSNIATSWDYANNLLLLGLPVMYKRVTETSNGEQLVKKAKADLLVSSVNLLSTENFSVTYLDSKLTISYRMVTACKSVSLKLMKDNTTLLQIDPRFGPWNELNPEGTQEGFTAGDNTFEISLQASPEYEGQDWIDPTQFTNGTYSLTIVAGDADNNYHKLNGVFTLNADSVTNVSAEVDSFKVAEVSAIYGGSFGNTLNFTIDMTNNTYYFKVYSENTLLEALRIATVPDGVSPQEFNSLLLEGLKNIKSNTVTIYITEESNFTLSNVSKVYLTGGEDADESRVREEIQYLYAEYVDKLIYNIKFITSGGYTDITSSSTPIANAMVNLAEARGDCIAIPDVPINLPKDEVTMFFQSTNSSYGTAYAPWTFVQLADPRVKKWVAPSFEFLFSVARSVSAGNPIYLPPAGVQRATLSNVIDTEYQIGSATLKEWQSSNPQSINPIMKIHNYGYVIFGQRTLYASVGGTVANEEVSALQELSVRLVANEIKRNIYNISMYLSFDQNNLHTWNAFRARLEPELDKMKINNGITDYKVVMVDPINTDSRAIHGLVKVSITHAAEDFVIDFQLEQSSVVFNEEENLI